MTAPKYKPYSVDAYNTLDVRRIVSVGSLDAFYNDREELIGALILVTEFTSKHTNGYDGLGGLIIRNKKSKHFVTSVGYEPYFFNVKCVPFKGRIC